MTQNWFSDTGATHHVAPYLSSFAHVEEYKGPNKLHIGNRQGLPIQNTSSASFYNLSNRNCFLNQILHVPSITKPLRSVQKFTRDSNVCFEFYPAHFIVKDLASRILLLSG